MEELAIMADKRYTNKDIQTELELVKKDLQYLTESLSNETFTIQGKQDEISQSIKQITIKLLDPDNGAIARVNQNTKFRLATTKVLFTIWTAILGIIAKLIFWH